MLNSSVVILVVDDNPATRYSTSRILRSVGWTVEEAETGQEAIDKALTGVDLMVLDINLPDIDGYTVCRTLRENHSTARLPILHLSASFVSADHKVTGLEAGADGYLTHPIEPPVLIATVNAFLRTRQAENELRVSEARFRAVFENALTGVSLLNEDLIYVDVNPTMCRLLDRDRSEMVGHPFRELVIDSHQNIVDEIVETLTSEPAWHGQLPLLTPNQKIVPLEWHFSIHANPGLRLAIATDISDRLRYEAERESLLQSERAARSEAERANSLKDEFLATLSHELRTPLNAIVGWSKVLQLSKLSPAETTQALSAIERNARAQAQMISDLLDVSRITSGKLRLDVELLDPIAVIELALSAILPTAEAKSIRVTKSFDSSCGAIFGDASRLQQVIWNLVNNAVKFTPKEGHVSVVLRRVNSHVEISVSDDGEGISTELLPRIFERFRQGDGSSTREHGGLGLGLAISKQLIDLHGGSIFAESPGPGKGAVFTVSLPITPNQLQPEAIAPTSGDEHEQARTAIDIDLTGIRVLIVEDNEDSRQMLMRLVTDTGAEVAEATSVDDALALLDKFPASVLVSDLGMPGRDGFELIREIRQRGYSGQTLPAIALTAFARNEDRRRALVSGFQVHLSKPVDPHELTATIASLVGRTE